MIGNKEKILAVAIIVLTFATISFLVGCARFQNRGEMFEKGIFEKGDSIANV